MKLFHYFVSYYWLENNRWKPANCEIDRGSEIKTGHDIKSLEEAVGRNRGLKVVTIMNFILLHVEG
jgi:hypothetical protein